MYIPDEIFAIEVLDSRGHPTVEAMVRLRGCGSVGTAIAPSGASKGEREAVELRDGSVRYLGRGVLNAVHNINDVIALNMVGHVYDSQAQFDDILKKLDGTKDKHVLGSNAILPVSLAFAKACAASNGLILASYIAQEEDGQFHVPTPMVNVINGGAHANNRLDIQEFMIVPAAGNTFAEKVRICAEIIYKLKGYIVELSYSTAVGDEGGFAPMFNDTRAALNAIMFAIEDAGYEPGVDVSLALDVAANELYKKDLYDIDNMELANAELIEYFQKLVSEYPIISLEDPIAEHDNDGWVSITNKMQDKMIVGDDLFVSHSEYLLKGIRYRMANSILVKPNQVGTLTETLEVINIAKRYGYNFIISHRSGETEDVSIAHIASATKAGYIKTGSLCRGERTCKYNELIRLENGFYNHFHKPANNRVTYDYSR